MKINSNPWDLLGITYGASLEEIKKAYKSKALKYHPDRFDGDADMFRKIRAAYDQLKTESHVPIVVKPDTKLVNVKLAIQQQINGINGVLEIPKLGLVELNLPAGLRKNDKFKIQHQGNHYIINIQEKLDKNFTRHGLNVIMDLELNVITAMTGGTVEIQTPSGTVLPIHISPGIDHKSQIVIEQHGMYDRRTKRHGNLHVFISLDIPKLESQEEIQEFIQKLKG